MIYFLVPYLKDDFNLNSANKYYKEKLHINSYDNKYLYGKSIFDDFFDESFINNQVKKLNEESKILEIGSYTEEYQKN